MEETPNSPLSQLLNTLGITKEDLNRRSDQMRQFLTSGNDISSRVTDQPRSLSRTSTVSAPLTRQTSGGSALDVRDASPSPEPTDDDVEHHPTRPLDNMEMVLERQRLNRIQQQKRSNTEAPTSSARDSSPTPGPSHIAPLNSSALTPTRNNHYREHITNSAPPPPTTSAESPSLARNASRPPAPYPYYYYPSYGTQAQFLSLPFRTSQGSTALQTPVKSSQQAHPSSSSPPKSPLPPSSPPDDSSPTSSPVLNRRANIVSSPMDDASGVAILPYTLPPGPYSLQRPHHSYAGIIGQAILSSKDHRLTLQEIYDWICTVYPHFKRGERTWMNSIRHVLSTTVHFRKVTRERSAGRSYWAILDEDIYCFANGGYRKPGSLKRGGGGITVTRPPPKPKKRSADEVDDEDEDESSPQKGVKRPKNSLPALLPSPRFSSSAPSSSSQPPGILPDLVHPNDKPSGSKRPTTQQQTYYDSCVSAAPTYSQSEIIFPRIPKSSSYRLISSSPIKGAGDEEEEEDELEEDELESEDELAPPSSAPLPSSSPPSSVPALTPHGSSSSPTPLDTKTTPPELEEDEDKQAESKSASDGETLQPGIDLLEMAAVDDSDDDEEDIPLMLLSQGSKSDKKKRTTSKHRPSSSTLHRRKTAAAAKSSRSARHKKTKSASVVVVPVIPSTPPRNKSQRKVYVSPTPLYRKGPTSPSTGFSFISGSPARISAARDDVDDEPPDPMRTPSRKGKSTAVPSSLFPVTPQRRLLFPSDSSSPFRTPGGNMLSASPFRTPGSGRGGIFDPHDPSTLLDEELSSFGAAAGRESPAGLYAKGDLYSSPNPVDGSPGKWARWW
ncbi:hypothetical protein C8F01DRAFT_714340 [Mycena amicta]|nr:hypothetical protein C8F01DRAFT_714340 [Mycena amicta]